MAPTAIPTPATPERFAVSDTSRREFHSDVPRLSAFVGDTADYLRQDLFQRTRLRVAGATDVGPAGIGSSRNSHRTDLSGEWADTERLWDLLLDHGWRAPGFRLVNNGTTLPRATVCRSASVGDRTLDDLIEPNRLLELYDAGATVVLQGLQHLDAVSGKLSNNLALELDQPVQVNAYLSPPNAKGLDIHFDYHDVIVSQLDGTKRWRVWEPIERTRRPLRSGPTIAMPTIEELGDPTIERTMSPGDSLAIPRGFPHCAETVDDRSVHLTMGIMALSWERIIRLALVAGASGTALADRRLPGSEDDPAATSQALGALEALVEPAALQRLIRAEVWRRQPRTRRRPRLATDSGPATALRVTPGPLMWLEHDDVFCRLFLGDRALKMPIEALPVLEGVLSSTTTVCADDLRGHLDLDSAMVVVERLVREGILQRV